MRGQEPVYELLRKRIVKAFSILYYNNLMERIPAHRRMFPFNLLPSTFNDPLRMIVSMKNDLAEE
jgi:hypothetical protein